MGFDINNLLHVFALGGVAMAALCLMLLFYVDRRNWNQGACRRCGSYWQMLGRTNGGAREYACASGHRTIIRHGADKEWLRF
jgi:hypothetical protein